MSLKVFSRFLILAALLAPAVRAESPTWTARFDVDLGVIHDVAAGGGVAYAATYNGVFRSEDGRPLGGSRIAGTWDWPGGRRRRRRVRVRRRILRISLGEPRRRGHWKASDPGAPVSVLAVDPREPNTVWAGSYFDGVLWTSEDRGEHWARIEINTDGYGIHNCSSIRSTEPCTLRRPTRISIRSPPARPGNGSASRRLDESIVAGGSAAGVLYGATRPGLLRELGSWRDLVLFAGSRADRRSAGTGSGRRVPSSETSVGGRRDTADERRRRKHMASSFPDRPVRAGRDVAGRRRSERT